MVAEKKKTLGGLAKKKIVCENLHHAPPRWLMVDP